MTLNFKILKIIYTSLKMDWSVNYFGDECELFWKFFERSINYSAKNKIKNIFML